MTLGNLRINLLLPQTPDAERPVCRRELMLENAAISLQYIVQTLPVFSKDWNMTKLLKSLANAIPGAVLTAIVWYFMNRFTAGKGGGILDRQPWPINNIYLCAAIGAGFAVICSMVALYIVDRRNAALEAAAGLLGLRYRGKVSKSSLGISGPLHVFDDWAEGTNLLYGEFHSTGVQVFDLKKQCTTTSRNSSTSQSGTSTTTEHQTIFLLPLPEGQLVPVQILKKNAVSWIIGAMGFDGVEFSTNDQFASEEDRGDIQRFNDDWLVVRGLSRKGNRSAAATEDAAEDALRRLEATISFPFLKSLLVDQRWSVEVCDSHVAIWMHKKRVRPTQLADCLRRVTELHRILIEGPADSQAKLIATGDTLMQMNLGVGRMLPIAVSGCLGMLVAFVIFIPIFFLFADKAPWIVFVWPFFGMAVVAGSVYIGTRLANNWRKRWRQTTI